MPLLLLGLFFAGWALARLTETPARKPQGQVAGQEKRTRLLEPDEAPPEFVAGQPVCRLEDWAWGRVRRCQRRDGGWHYEVDFTEGAAELSGDELVP